jgi:hypothetical protein
VASSKTQTASAPLGSDSISSWGENPLFHITRTCLGFLQNLFKQAPDGDFRWDADRQVTQIVITDELPLHSEQLNKRPAIVTVRSPVQWAGIGLEQRRDENLRTGAREHTDLITGHMTFNCLSRVKVEAEQLGWLVARHIWILHRLFMRAGFHKMGQRVQILAATPAGAIVTGDTEGEIHNVPVIAPYEFQWTERITPLNLDVLNEIEISMAAFMREPEEKTEKVALRGTSTNFDVVLKKGRIRPPHVRGRPLSTEAERDAIPSAQSGDLSVNIVVDE